MGSFGWVMDSGAVSDQMHHAVFTAFKDMAKASGDKETITAINARLGNIVNMELMSATVCVIYERNLAENTALSQEEKAKAVRELHILAKAQMENKVPEALVNEMSQVIPMNESHSVKIKWSDEELRAVVGKTAELVAACAGGCEPLDVDFREAVNQAARGAIAIAREIAGSSVEVPAPKPPEPKVDPELVQQRNQFEYFKGCFAWVMEGAALPNDKRQAVQAAFKNMSGAFNDKEAITSINAKLGTIVNMELIGATVCVIYETCVAENTTLSAEEKAKAVRDLHIMSKAQRENKVPEALVGEISQLIPKNENQTVKVKWSDEELRAVAGKIAEAVAACGPGVEPLDVDFRQAVNHAAGQIVALAKSAGQ